MQAEQRAYLAERANAIRRLTIEAIGTVGIGHIGGSLSIAELLSVLYFEKMKIDPANPHKPERDRLVLSKGHAGPALYAALALRGYFDESKLWTLNQPGTDLPSHCDMNRTPGVDMTAGSLGQGISCGVGMALASRLRGYESYVYAVIGDGESQEGQVWEASMAAAHFKLDHLIVFLDHNRLQIDGPVDAVMSLGNPAEKWRAFGFFVQEVDGHDVADISAAVERAKTASGRPSMIVLHTVKGKGVPFVEAAGAANHNMAISSEQVGKALLSLSRERERSKEKANRGD